MADDIVSRSALGAAFLRAMENQRRGDSRLFADPLARNLLTPGYRALFGVTAIPGMKSLLLSRADQPLPGVAGGLLGRTCYIDDALTTALADGLGQIVILGAGLDSRAYRIPGIDQAHVYEIDQPAVIDYKRERLAQILGAVPAHVTLIPLNFDLQRMDSALYSAGFQPELPAFFIWEGVSQYLIASAVDATLRFVASCATGSRIVFTYVHRGVLDPTSPLYNPDMLERLRKLGEPWRFGLHPNQVGKYLDERGLRLVDQADAATYRRQYLQPHGRDMVIMDIEFTVLAEATGQPRVVRV
jgi:methyltransferase (TIGR00027 family)